MATPLIPTWIVQVVSWQSYKVELLINQDNKQTNSYQGGKSTSRLRSITHIHQTAEDNRQHCMSENERMINVPCEQCFYLFHNMFSFCTQLMIDLISFAHDMMKGVGSIIVCLHSAGNGINAVVGRSWPSVLSFLDITIHLNAVKL